MSLENVQEDVSGERSPAALRAGHSKAAHDELMHYAGGVAGQIRKIVAFKFGGSSLLGAHRMLHPARLVRSPARPPNVPVLVSPIERVTDHLPAIPLALRRGQLGPPRHQAAR